MDERRTLKLDPFGAFVDRCDDAGSGIGPLAGLRVAVKDNIATAGLAWTAGLPLLASRVADRDAPCVQQLRAAGAAIIGTTETDAAGFGMMTPGVINPIARGYSAGGSSGGSAAAVAGALVDIALGTDTGGSVRVPAACCGIFGLKPTHGRISAEGVTPLSQSFDHVGLMARDLVSVERAAAVLLPAMPQADDVPRRVGFDPERLSQSHPRIRAAIEGVLGRLSVEGHDLIEVALPDPVSISEVHGVVVCAEAIEIWRDHWPSKSSQFAEQARTGLAYASTLDPGTIAEARSHLPELQRRISRCFDEAEIIVGPTLAVPPPKAGARTARFMGADVPIIFALLAETCTFNVSGHPALSMPLAAHGDGGIPIALQIAGRPDQEGAVLALAGRIGQLGTHV